ncbi:uncharacterized protein LOC129589531 isoform X2 [Paramacrobiotus metropolitanus]|uniref:uncharacterized protein LOC129589531 isoform X2 n=1 Tax=Paramacrobiotus metropolitanus TaxID=2943436 RepID=UPI0024459FA2|nr:uncharacterized protein LOC129589531 isoform X2 [Paramacrobiotus metropolitanus]
MRSGYDQAQGGIQGFLVAGGFHGPLPSSPVRYSPHNRLSGVTGLDTRFPYNNNNKFRAITEIHIRTARLPLDGGLDCALWDALEAALPMPDEAEEQALRELLQRLKVGGDLKEEKTPKSAVTKALCQAQSSDPRPSTHYRGKKWCVVGLEGVQLEKLSRIALNFLVHVQNYGLTKKA